MDDESIQTLKHKNRCHFHVSNKKRQLSFLAGFTAIEVLLVIVVISILAAVVIPRIGREGLYEKFQVYTLAHQIAADTRLTRRLAITTGDKHRMWFEDTGGNARNMNVYWIEREVGSSWITVGAYPKVIPDEVRVRSSITGDTDLTFKNDGSLDETQSQAFNCRLKADLNIRYDIHVRLETGRVKLYVP